MHRFCILVWYVRRLRFGLESTSFSSPPSFKSCCVNALKVSTTCFNISFNQSWLSQSNVIYTYGEGSLYTVVSEYGYNADTKCNQLQPRDVPTERYAEVMESELVTTLLFKTVMNSRKMGSKCHVLWNKLQDNCAVKHKKTISWMALDGFGPRPWKEEKQ
jgi:hypothetical protein